MKTQKFEIVSAQSNIAWTGRKVTGAHNGTIVIKNDITSIKILDVTDPATNAQFAGHLASDDFFSSEKFPESVFVITSVTPRSVNNYHIDGDLTIKGITHEVGFGTVVNTDGSSITATGKITIDRTKYAMKFRSGNFFKDLGDTLIYNDFDLDVTITAKAV